MDGNEFKKIVTKEKKGNGPFFWRSFFSLIAIFYSIAVRIHHFLYYCGLKRVQRLDVPVISVGNLTLGGTGKSPTVAWLVRVCLERGNHPGVLSRGYKANHFQSEPATEKQQNFLEENDTLSDSTRFRKQNDEAAELASEFPSIPHFLSPSRYKAGRALLKENPIVDRLLLDDGFQHRRLARDFDIVLLDALDPFGTGRLFPAGFLREPISALRRADAVLLSRADLISETERVEIRSRVRSIAPGALWGETAQVPTALVRWTENRFQTEPSDLLHDITVDSRPRLPFCGIGNPMGFLRMLRRHEFQIVDGFFFPDHTRWDDRDLMSVAERGERLDVGGFLTTMKDLVKIRRSELAGRPLWGVKISLQFISGERELLERLP